MTEQERFDALVELLRGMTDEEFELVYEAYLILNPQVAL